jgi:hypothetical protein
MVARPMGRPIEPEVVADAVWRAASGDRREYWLGWPTILTILGNALAPAFLDRYLARHAVEGQQTSQRLAPGRADNLDAPVHALHRTRGSFGAEAGATAPLVAGDIMRLATVAAGAALFLALGMAMGRWRS